MMKKEDFIINYVVVVKNEFKLMKQKRKYL